MGTMGLLGSLLVGRSEATTVYECRQCGTTLDARDDCCPACGCSYVAEYEVA